MHLPLASILWVNYNSTNIINIVKESLDGIKDLDYPRYEVIIVDNGSTDGSFEAIKSHVERIGLKARIVRLSRNLGFTGGNNVAYRLASRESKYIVLLNNDAVPYPESLREMVEFLESMPSVAAVQGIIYKYGSKDIDTAGNYLTELLTVHMAKVRPPKPMPITYADGAYCVIRRDALAKTGLVDRLFPWEVFAYFDDVYLGLRFWNSGFKVYTLPVDAAVHMRSGTFSKMKRQQMYYLLRSWAVRVFMIRSRYSALALALCLRTAIQYRLVRAVVDGYRLAKKIGERFSARRTPMVRIEKLHKIPAYIVYRRLLTLDAQQHIHRIFCTYLKKRL